MDPLYVQVDFVGVILASVASFVIGMLWYSPVLFGKQWMQLMGTSSDHKPSGMGKALSLSFIGGLIMAYVMAHFVELLAISDKGMAVQFAFWSWLGFVATTSANEYIFALKPKPWALWVLNNGNLLISMIVMALILIRY